MNLIQDMTDIANDIDVLLEGMLPESEFSGDPAEVARYASIDAGKRIRAYLTVQIAELFNVPREAALRAAAAIEMVHNFSLIHDDLPCIDNDVLRRGKPSSWAAFGVYQAVLGGDYLLARAFGILAADEKISPDPAVRLELIKIMSEMTCGMVHGEFMDIRAETGIFNTEPEVRRIQNLKTGCIFHACAEFGMVLGNAPANARTAINKYIDAFGLCFQITDDILDEIGDEALVGKTLHKDAAAGKATFISLCGLEGAQLVAAELSAAAKEAIADLDDKANGLRQLADYLIDREY